MKVTTATLEDMARAWSAYNSPTGRARAKHVARLVKTYAPAPEILARMCTARGIFPTTTTED